MKQFDQSFLEEQQKAQRATIFRIYNYYRVLISFLFLFLFLDPNLNDFVGKVDSELFKITILSYIIINVVLGIATLFADVNFLSKPTTAIFVIIGDIIALTLLMSASGGVSSGLGSFLFFTLAFAGGMVYGRVSTVLPAIAFILTIYGEFYLFFLNENDIQSFFQAGLLGIVYFVTNILFQTL
jgi:two-component system sensor histidine kinase PilS (NtrC family)